MSSKESTQFVTSTGGAAILTLELRQIDLDAATIRLDPGRTKNDDGRLVYLPV